MEGKINGGNYIYYSISIEYHFVKYENYYF